jgi:transcriptional regulator of acetoin/glycerol metabolism
MPGFSASKLHFPVSRQRASAGWRLKVEESVVVAGRPPRNRLTGHVILAVLLFAFPLLVLLVVEQGRVIGAQRVLIQQLSSDSQQLSVMRMREQNRTRQAAPAAKLPQAETQQQPSAAPQAGATPEHKKRKRHRKQALPAPPPPPQEYPATRSMPVRKAV